MLGGAAARPDRGARRGLRRRPHQPVPAVGLVRRRSRERCASDPEPHAVRQQLPGRVRVPRADRRARLPAVGPARRARRRPRLTRPTHARLLDHSRKHPRRALDRHRARSRSRWSCCRSRSPASARRGCASPTSRSSTCLLSLGLNIVVGFAGLLDLGYIAFYAVGAYVYALLACPHFNLHLPFWVILPIGARGRVPLRRAARHADAEAARRLPRDRHARLRRDHPHLPQQPLAAGQHHQRAAGHHADRSVPHRRLQLRAARRRSSGLDVQRADQVLLLPARSCWSS